MARREVIEIVCDRCGRRETQPKSSSEETAPYKFEFTVSFQGEETKYEDLCIRCRDTLSNYFKRCIKEKLQGKDEKESDPEGKQEGKKTILQRITATGG